MADDGREERQRVVIYTDGACKRNPGPGGWAAIIIVPSLGSSNAVQVSGGCAHTTNNIMELQGCIQGVRRALRILEERGETYELVVYTDSAYVVKGMTEWMAGWKKKNWHTGMNREVKNKELWIELEALDKQAGGVQWRWVRGHSGNPLNELADRAASAQAQRNLIKEPRFL